MEQRKGEVNPALHPDENSSKTKKALYSRPIPPAVMMHSDFEPPPHAGRYRALREALKRRAETKQRDQARAPTYNTVATITDRPLRTNRKATITSLAGSEARKVALEARLGLSYRYDMTLLF